MKKKKKFHERGVYTLRAQTASIGYLLCGLYVGWSSKLSLLQDQSVEFNGLNRDEVSWIVSIFPLTIVITSIALNQLYYWHGTKVLMLTASLSMMLSWILPIFYAEQSFSILFTTRILGGFGSGIILVLVPVYMKEIGGLIFNTTMVDLLIFQFGMGIFLQYFLDSLPFQHLSIMSTVFSLLYFVICYFIPESPRYEYYCEVSRKQKCDVGNNKLHNTWNEEDLQQKSFADLR